MAQEQPFAIIYLMIYAEYSAEAFSLAKQRIPLLHELCQGQ